MSKKLLSKRGIFLAVALVAVLGLALASVQPKKAEAAFDPSNLIGDGDFINTGKMDVGAIQRFLDSQGGFIRGYSEGGRSAAQIIYDAAHGYNEASGSINGISINTSTGTVNPQVLIVTLQKEQSLITRGDQVDSVLNKAMGYACPDSGGCNAAYSGFTKQVENAAWQFRYNYERAQGHGFGDYQVGQSFSFDDWNGTHAGTFGNRATASLYRYTPHVYNGNYNFYNLMMSWFSVDEYAHVFVTETNSGVSLANGQSTYFTLTVRNTGSATWQQGTVNLGTSGPLDRVSIFTREGNGPSGWSAPQRVYMQENSVAPGAEAHFIFWFRNDGVSPGTYREYFRLVADGITWMEDYGIYWEINVPQPSSPPLPPAPTPSASYSHSFVTETNSGAPLATGQSTYFTLTVRNTGSATWQRGTVNLGTSGPLDRISSFTREGNGPSGWSAPQRVYMQENSVAPGAEAHFIFWFRNDGVGPGNYREYFRLVADGITWMEDYGIYWEINVP